MSQQVEETINENNRAEDGGLPGTSALQATGPSRGRPPRSCVRAFDCVFVCAIVCAIVLCDCLCVCFLARLLRIAPSSARAQVDPAHVDRILLGLADYLGLNRSATLFILNPFTTTERPYGYRSGLSERGMPTSAPGLGSPRPRLHRDWAHPCHICTGTRLPGLGSPRPRLHRDWAHPCHICTGTRLPPATLRRDWAHRGCIGGGAGLQRGLGCVTPWCVAQLSTGHAHAHARAKWDRLRTLELSGVGTALSPSGRSSRCATTTTSSGASPRPRPSPAPLPRRTRTYQTSSAWPA
jgi:hypothetical protein